MKGTTTGQWRGHARTLVDELVASGALFSDPWQAAFTEVPRHVFVPRYRAWTADSEDAFVDARTPGWLPGAYANEALLTQYRPAKTGRVAGGLPSSSSSPPGVMAEMLEALDVTDGDRVLEIGTGTGYNAALLCHRLGDQNVSSIDIDPELVSAAGEHLDELGYTPLLSIGDGTCGLPAAAPFDKIIATAAVDHIPPAWIDQLNPGGLILAPLGGSVTGGLAKLAKIDDDCVEGRIEQLVWFMPMRGAAADPQRPGEDYDTVLQLRNPHRGTTGVDLAFISADEPFRFFLQLHLAGLYVGGFQLDDDGTMFAAGAGHWVQATANADGST